MDLYTNVDLLINGRRILQDTSVSVARKYNNQEVKTIAKGLAGVAKGAPDMTISVENVVPETDFEFLGSIVKAETIYEITVAAGSRTLTCNGYITEDDFNKAHEGAGTYKVSFMCEPADWVAAF